ncbi:DUF805 domain-containing protein [Brevundimonas staleyi]|uniref:DUF805 domain-containing protein n=1 Tax=Brevundimonas staleyi TaxID=74326 RepID=A0ABW0FYM1_9CAUL
MSRLAYLISVLGLWLVLFATQPLILGLPDFAESGRILYPLWRGEFQTYGAAIHQQDQWSTRYAVLGALTFGLLAAFLVLSARRLRDLGRPGYYAWIALVPFVGAQALFAVLILLPGDVGKNAYGPAPQARADHEMQRGSASPARRA